MYQKAIELDPRNAEFKDNLEKLLKPNKIEAK